MTPAAELPVAPVPFWKQPALLLAAGLLALRALYSPWCELFPEEAYYWNYAQHLDIGYLDHPPMVAWLIALGTRLFGHGEWGVRVGALGCSLAASFFAYRLAHTLYRDRRAAAVAALLVQLLPYFFLAGWMMTPDAPLSACWAATLYFLARVLFDGDGRAWLGVGVFLGLGMLSKYTLALLGPATLLFLALDPSSRHWFRRVAPYASVALAVAIFSPVVLWNVRHGWASFAFQSEGRIHEAHRFSLHYLAGAILVVLTPLGIVLAGRVLAGSGVAGDEDQARRRVLFARIFTLVPLAVFVVFSLAHRVKLNWTGPLWLAIIPAVAAQIVAARAGWLRRSWNVTAAALCVGYAVLLQYLGFGLPGVGYARETELLPVGWRQMAREIDARREQLQLATPGTPVRVVGMDRDFIASEAAFYSPDPVRAAREITGAHLFGNISLMYAFWFPPAQQDGATMLLAAFEASSLHSERVAEHAASLGPVEQHAITLRGRTVRPYYTRVVYGYRPEPASH